jgi:hypothetical protein
MKLRRNVFPWSYLTLGSRGAGCRKVWGVSILLSRVPIDEMDSEGVIERETGVPEAMVVKCTLFILFEKAEVNFTVRRRNIGII